MKLNRKVKFTAHTTMVDVTVQGSSGDPMDHSHQRRYAALVIRHSADRRKRDRVFETPPAFITRRDAYNCAMDALIKLKAES